MPIPRASTWSFSDLPSSSPNRFSAQLCIRSQTRSAVAMSRATSSSLRRQQRLNFNPLPQGHGTLRPTSLIAPLPDVDLRKT